MTRRAPKDPPTGYPEIAVKRESFNKFFDSPLPTSTFHDLVNRRKILPMPHLRGFYLLNASLRRLGLREVPSLPEDVSKLSGEDIGRLAFAGIDRVLFPDPSFLLMVEALDVKDIHHPTSCKSGHLSQHKRFIAPTETLMSKIKRHTLPFLSSAGLLPALLVCCTNISAWAEESPAHAELNGKVSSRAGEFEFVNGVPTAASSADLFEAMDFQRAAQVYLWSLPAMGLKGAARMTDGRRTPRPSLSMAGRWGG